MSVNNKIRVGSRVRHLNLVGTVVGRDGNAWLFQPNGSREQLPVPESQLTLILNEGSRDCSITTNLYS